MQTSIDKDLPRNVTKLVEEVVHPKIPLSSSSPPDNPQNSRHWGLKHEDSARHAYASVESKKHHKLKLISKGFLISRKRPFIGASLDNVRTCGCAENCSEVVVEFKCPGSTDIFQRKKHSCLLKLVARKLGMIIH